MVYYTADLHIGHANIIKHCQRPFSTVDEMNQVLLRNWNTVIHRNDTVYILGDLFFRNSVPAEEYLLQMKGKKRLLIGNHDSGWMKKVELGKYFESVSFMEEITDGSHRITLCHYPMMSWNGCNRGAFQIYGHIHNNRNDSYWPLLAESDLSLNAGVDINGFRPVSLQDLIKNNQTYRKNAEAQSNSFKAEADMHSKGHQSNED